MSAKLQRGLALLELLAKRHELSFGELAEALGGMNPASLSRLLKSLIASGHVFKDPRSGSYACGHRMAAFAAVRTPDRSEWLVATYGSLQDRLSEKHDLTVILLERVLLTLVNIRKAETPASPHMQEVGRINDDPRQPWVHLLAAYEAAALALLTEPAHREAAQLVARHGYAYDDQTLRPGYRRLGFPLFDESGNVVGALGFGGSLLQITDDGLPALIAEVTAELKGRPGKTRT